MVHKRGYNHSFEAFLSADDVCSLGLNEFAILFFCQLVWQVLLNIFPHHLPDSLKDRLHQTDVRSKMAQGSGDKIELVSINASEHHACSDDTPSLLEKQTRTRRLFSAVQLFGFSFMSLGTWGGVGGYVRHSNRTYGEAH